MSNIERRTLNVEVGRGNTYSSLQCSTFDVRCSTFVFLCLLILQGCARLSPGAYSTNHPQTALVIRGYLDWYSTGMDRLTTELTADGVSTQAFREEQWGGVGDQLCDHPHQPVILVGFSYGADDVILIARQMADHHLPVDLLITIDPVTPAEVPINVKQCVNFYEPNGVWDIFPWLRGVPLAGKPNVQNINVRSRPDLDEPGTSHATIAGNEKIHLAIRKLVKPFAVSP